MQACRMGLFRKGVHMAFEEFTKKKSRGSTELKVSISRAGLFILNSASVNQHFKGFDYVVLLWDSENRKVGIKPVKDHRDNAYTVNTNKSVASISGTAFLGHCGLNPLKGHDPYKANWNEKLALLEFKV